MATVRTAAVIKALVNAGADTDAKDDRGRTSLDVADSEDNPAAAELLR